MKAKPSILMVDTNSDTLSLSTASLQAKGYSVFPVNDIQSLAEVLQQTHPEVIVVKTCSGGLQAAPIMHEINRHGDHRDLPIIYHFVDEGIYLLQRKIEDGRMEYRSIKADDMEPVLQTAVQ